MDPVEIVTSGLAAYRRAETGYVDGAWYENRGSLLLISLGLPPPWANVTQVLGPLDEPAIALREAWSRFAEAGRPMSIQVVEGADESVEAEARSMGLAPREPLIGLVRIPASRPFAVRDGIAIEAVQDVAALKALLDVQAEGFEMDRALLDRLHPPAAMRTAGLTLYAGFLNGDMVSSAVCYVFEGIAGISGVCTVPRARDKGLATLLTDYALAKSGASAGWLLADAGVAPFYERMGFSRVCTLRSYAPR